MKATELMIGVWVEYATLPCKVIGIAEGGYSVNLQDMGWCPAHKISPIPLTPEILEKNGWAKGDGYYCYRLCDAESLEYWLDDCRLEKIWMGCRGDKFMVTFRAFVSYVHTFQHALMLAGIDKEVQL